MRSRNRESIKIKALKKAISKFGTQKKFAEQLPILNKRPPDQRDVAKWLKTGLPVRWVIPVERLTGVPRHELAPEFYPNE